MKSKQLGLMEIVKNKGYTYYDKKCSTNLSGLDMTIVTDCISVYNSVVSKLPYPLSDMECELKYNSIAICMTDELDNVIRVDCGVHVMVDEYRAIYLFKDTWVIYDIDKTLIKNIKQIDSYESSVGYKEFRWVIDRILKGLSTDGYYEWFDSLLYKKLGKQGLIEELEKSYNIRPISDYIPDNCILVKDSGTLYNLDFTLDTVVNIASGSKIYKIINGEVADEDELKAINIYDCNIRELKDGVIIPIEECKELNKYSCFEKLYDLLTDEFNESLGTTKFRGLIYNNDFLLEVEGVVYYSKAFLDSEIEAITCGKIIGLNDGVAYIEDINTKNINKYTIGEWEESLVYIHN